MVSLRATSAAGGLGLPLAVGGGALSEVELGPVWSIAPHVGQAGAVADRLGVELPLPGQVVALGAARLLWVGPGRALLVGAVPPDLNGLAAAVEQGDGMVGLRLEGHAARDVLARLVPLDLRDRAFPEGATARTPLNHMSVTLSRVGREAWEVLGMRSMARTLVREIEEAMRHVAARDGL